MHPLRNLLLVSLGRVPSMEKDPSPETWTLLFAQARYQSLIGVLYEGVMRLPPEQRPPERIMSEWTRLAGLVAGLHSLQEMRAEELGVRFSEMGLRTCLLKGTGLSRLYPVPERRMGGDIDIWVEGRRRNILKALGDGGIPVHDILYQECKADFFNDTIVEVHFHPTKFYNPVLNARLQRFFRKNAPFREGELAVPDARFNAVYCMAHMYRHYLEGGIGIRQMLDYYYILRTLPAADRESVMRELRRLGMGSFTGAVMLMMQYSFGLEDQFLLCPPDRKRGGRLANDCVGMGNFGRGDPRNRAKQGETRLGRFIRKNKRVMSNFRYYPREVFWSPFARAGQFLWRLVSGYLPA